jgi:hypothetical protein
MHIHGRNRVLLGALFAAFALLVPANAFASHDLGIYKVEQQVTLDSDEQTADLSCTPGDYALDGMWRVDHADQDDDDLYLTALGRAVDVPEAYPKQGFGAGSNGHNDTYHYLFEKNAIGRVQLKVFLTCIKQKTEAAGSPNHQHSLTVTAHTDTGLTHLQSGDHTSATACQTGNQFVSTPGYKINWSGGPASDYPQYLGRLSRSWPDTKAMLNWHWVIDLSQDAGSTVDYYYSCVNRKVPAAGGEKHKLVYRYNGVSTDTINSKSIRTVRQSCGAAYKAVVAGFDFVSDPVGPPVFNNWASPTIPDLNSDPSYPAVPHLWYLGMDPQPKSRDFKFLNGDPGSAWQVHTTAICLNYRTT